MGRAQIGIAMSRRNLHTSISVAAEMPHEGTQQRPLPTVPEGHALVSLSQFPNLRRRHGLPARPHPLLPNVAETTNLSFPGRLRTDGHTVLIECICSMQGTHRRDTPDVPRAHLEFLVIYRRGVSASRALVNFMLLCLAVYSRFVSF